MATSTAPVRAASRTSRTSAAKAASASAVLFAVAFFLTVATVNVPHKATDAELLDWWQTSANLTGRLDTAPIREPDVHDDHVRTSPLHPGDSFLDGPGFANDRDVGFGFEQRLDPIPDNFVVVNQHNP